MPRTIVELRASRARWIFGCALSLAACGTTHAPHDAGTSAGNGGGADHSAAGSGAAGHAGQAAADGGAAGQAGRAAAGSSAAGHAGGSAASGGASGMDEDGGIGACAHCIDGTLSWGAIGGLVAFTTRSTLDSCNTYHHTQTPARSGTAPLACEHPLVCVGSGLHGVSDVLQALADPDVQAALAKGDVLYGTDPRPVDGTVFEIVARAGTSVVVGSPCSGTGCSAIPAGVNALANLLRAIDDEQIQLNQCHDVFKM